MVYSKEESLVMFEDWLDDVLENSITINKFSNPRKSYFYAHGIPGANPEIDLEPDLISSFTQGELKTFKEFPLQFTSLEVFPEEIRKIPNQSKEELENFWFQLIANTDLSDQLFTALKTFHSDPNNAIPRLQDAVEEIKDQFSDSLPEDKLKNLQSAVEEINIPQVRPSMEEIFTAIEKTEMATLEHRENVSLLSLIQPMSEEGKNWLGNLFIHLIQNPDLEADVYGSLYAMNNLLLHYKSMSNRQLNG